MIAKIAVIAVISITRLPDFGNYQSSYGFFGLGRA